MVFKEPEKAWFTDLKESRREFNDVQNMIDSARFKFDRDLDTPKWVLGTSLVIILAVGFSNILVSDQAPPYLVVMAKVLGVLCLGAIFWGIWRVVLLANLQQTAMAWLYREKDKQIKHRNKR